MELLLKQMKKSLSQSALPIKLMVSYSLFFNLFFSFVNIILEDGAGSKAPLFANLEENNNEATGKFWTLKIDNVFDSHLLDRIRNSCLPFIPKAKAIHYEEKRRLIKLSFLASKSESLNKDFAFIEEKLSSLIEEKIGLYYELWNGSLLFSFRNCGVQKWHQDYCEKTYKSSVPYSVLIAIDDMKIDICPYQSINFDKSFDRIDVKKGGVVIFNGFAFHRGCSYSTLSFRIHYFSQRCDEKIRTIGCNIYNCQ